MNKEIQILIVENEILIANWLKVQLEDEGFKVYDPFDSGETALEFAETTKPDIVLMDIHINGRIDGIETARILTEKSNSQVIFITGYQEKPVLERAQEIEHLAYLIKPIEIEEIISVINKATKS